jgi:hypothetical protein
MRGSVWTSGGCRSWYLDATGRNSAIWPGSTISFRRRLRALKAADYQLIRPLDPAKELPWPVST